MDELMVAQKRYISSKRASRETGYAQDYIGQLVRLQKVSATRVGKAWFVDELELKRHLDGSQRNPRSDSAHESFSSTKIEYPSTWRPIIYSTDTSPLVPNVISDNRDINENKLFIEKYEAEKVDLGADFSASARGTDGGTAETRGLKYQRLSPRSQHSTNEDYRSDGARAHVSVSAGVTGPSTRPRPLLYRADVRFDGLRSGIQPRPVHGRILRSAGAELVPESPMGGSAPSPSAWRVTGISRLLVLALLFLVPFVV